jgi:hypothetical protein
MISEKLRATPRDNAGGPRDISLAASPPSAIGAEYGQENLASRSASPEAIAAARDLVSEGLVETGSLAESYARSLTEAAWRGDQPTVEVHLRQLRACVFAGIDFFKRFDAVDARGGGA